MPYSGSTTPPEAFGGDRAITVQTYLDVNIKLGAQFEGSTLLTLEGGGINYTVFITGSLPVILKGRYLTYSGAGIGGDIYKAPTYSGGVVTPYQNGNDINPKAGLSSILVGATVQQLGTLKFAPTYSFRGDSPQSKGGEGVLGGEKILAANTTYLLVLTSLDTLQQKASSFLSWFEGYPDLPRELSQ